MGLTIGCPNMPSVCSCLAELLIAPLFTPQSILSGTMNYIVALPVVEPTSKSHLKD